MILNLKKMLFRRRRTSKNSDFACEGCIFFRKFAYRSWEPKKEGQEAVWGGHFGVQDGLKMGKMRSERAIEK